jgi:hypothetical protein
LLECFLLLAATSKVLNNILFSPQKTLHIINSHTFSHFFTYCFHSSFYIFHPYNPFAHFFALSISPLITRYSKSTASVASCRCNKKVLVVAQLLPVCQLPRPSIRQQPPSATVSTLRFRYLPLYLAFRHPYPSTNILPISAIL